MSTSKLQRYTSKQLYKRFSKYGLVENTHPHWLVSSKGQRLELDFFIDKLSVAIEVQGQQHAAFCPLFHNDLSDFIEQVRRDTEKATLCERVGIDLLFIWKKGDIGEIIAQIYNKIDCTLNQDRCTDDNYELYLTVGPSMKLHRCLGMLQNIVRRFEKKQVLSENTQRTLSTIYPALCKHLEKEYYSPNTTEERNLQMGKYLYNKYCIPWQ